MKNFNNNEYICLANDLIGDIFYTQSSYRGKISTIRQYAEVIIRKVLDLEPDKMVTLGQKDIRDKVRALTNYEFIQNAMEVIRGKGNLSTHTQYLESLTPEDFNNIVDALFDMLSFLLIDYFEKYEFGSRNDVISSFSLLPPIIRFKVLNFLHLKYSRNIAIIDKLVLAIMKSFNVEEALKWVEKEKDVLMQMDTMSVKAFNETVERVGVEFANIIKSSGPPNMYQLCTEKISTVGATINNNGLLYSSFESALPYYKEKGILIGGDSETDVFNDIMGFLYLGRKEDLDKMSSDNNPYLVLEAIN
ncbi:hypothetical protein [Lacrimispora sp.]|uniref:hypothetical protein n=1 Tax=Lacrimispora sp. TaxID=2719234 RepID=UPI0028AA8A0E|nr:hypothetical protein [Lacrimispora sp.]